MPGQNDVLAPVSIIKLDYQIELAYSRAMGNNLTHAAAVLPGDADLEGLRRGLGRDGTPIPAYKTLGVQVRGAAAGSAVVRLPASGHLAAPGGGLLPGAFAVLADACCGCAIATALPAGGAALTAQLRVEFIRPMPLGQAWIEGRAEADAIDDDGGLARGEIVDQADQLLGVASLRVIKASHQGFRQARPSARAQPIPVGQHVPAVATALAAQRPRTRVKEALARDLCQRVDESGCPEVGRDLHFLCEELTTLGEVGCHLLFLSFSTPGVQLRGSYGRDALRALDLPGHRRRHRGRLRHPPPGRRGRARVRGAAVPARAPQDERRPLPKRRG